MNSLWLVLRHPVAQYVGWAVLHSLWQGVLVGVVFSLVRFAARRASANTRYLAGCLCLALALGCPLLTLRCGPAPAAASLAGFGAVGVAPAALLSVGQHVSRGSLFLANGAFPWLESSTAFLGRLAPQSWRAIRPPDTPL